MAAGAGWYASRLRQELTVRGRHYARDREHVESYGESPIVVFAPEDTRHGNFYDPAYTAIIARPEWSRRFDKIHAQGRSFPRRERKWRELDSSMSSDALLMNVFCTPGVVESPQVRNLLGVDTEESPVFGWRARVPLTKGRFDRTEVDMKWGSLLVEAKLTESDFQSSRPELVEAYCDLDEVFVGDLLPRVEIAVSRRKQSVEFPEDYTQDEMRIAPELWEPHVWEVVPETITGYASYQLIRNVLAAHVTRSSFCVMLDERRPDLREAWFQIMRAVKDAALRVRLMVLTWQELCAVLPHALQDFLGRKYGIVPPGTASAPLDEVGTQTEG